MRPLRKNNNQDKKNKITNTMDRTLAEDIQTTTQKACMCNMLQRILQQYATELF